jgi:hypothetical protein
MPTAIYGLGADIANLPRPAATVNITSSTNATPIVVTAAAAHGLQTGFIVIINGHATNTSANGIRKVTVLTSTTFSLQTLAGANVAGVGVGGATGTIQSLSLAGFNAPEDGVDGIDATSVNVPFEALQDMVAFMAYTMWANMQILAGGTLTTAVGSDITLSGNMLINGPTSLNAAAMSVTTAGRISLASNGRLAWATQRVANADATLNCGDGFRVVLAKPTAVRTLTIEQASDTDLQNGDWMRFYMWDPPTVGSYYEIIREGSGNHIARLLGTIAGAQEPCFVDIHVEGGVWRGSGGVGITTGTDW